MNTLLEFCLRNRLTVLLATLFMAVASIWVIQQMPVDVFPELKVPRVTVQTEAAGLSAEEVEQYVTIPINAAMQGTAGVKGVRDSSGSGLSFVWVDFDWNTDIYKARQIVAERLATVRESLPEGMSPELTPIISVTGEIMLLAVTGEKGIDPLEIRRMAEYHLRNRLMSIPGVGQVTVLGGRLPEFQVLYNTEKMRQAGITHDQLESSITKAQSTLSAGYLEDVAGLEIPLQQRSRATTTEHIKRALIEAHPSGILRVEDVADVRIGGAPRRGNAGFKGGDAVILSVQKAPGANTMQLTAEVDKAVEDFRKSRLPKGMTIYTDAYRQSDFITLSLENGKETLLIAALVVLVVLVLTLLNVRTAIITLLSMPLSVMLGMTFFPLLGLAINIMTLGGLAVVVGDVVDNAIIFVEVAWRKLNLNAQLPESERKSKMSVILDAKGEILSSMGYSSVIILLVFTPLLFLSGVEGQFYQPLGISYMVALLASLIVALTITPVLIYLLFKPSKRKNSHADSVSARLIKAIYAPILRFCMSWPKLVCSVMISISAGAIWLASGFGTSFLPPFNEDCYTVFVNAVPGSSLAETERMARQAMKRIEKIEGVKSVAQRAGRAENDEHAEPVSAAELLVRVDLNADQKRIRSEINAVLRGVPGMGGMIGFPLAHRISSALSGSASEIAINIYGTDLAQLREAAQKASEILNSLPEVADARANREILVDTLRIEYTREKLAAYGLSMEDAAKQVSAAFNGLQLGQIIQNLDRWNIMMRLDVDLRQSLSDVKQLQLLAPNGKVLKLEDVAHVYRIEETNLILRDNGLRKAMISCNPAPHSNLGDLAKACRENLDPVMKDMGCTVEYAGTIKSREEAGQRLYIMGGIILALIVLLLSRSLGGIRRALLTLVNVPLCLVGGIAAVWISANHSWSAILAGDIINPILSVSSLVGFVTVIGFAIRSGLILLNRYRNLEDAGMSAAEAIREGSLERVIPIIMTSLTTILGLLPLIWAIDKPGGELLAPLAIVQFGGLLSATLLNLLVIPASSVLFAPWLNKAPQDKA